MSYLYRYGTRVLATDGRMLVRQNGLNPMFVDSLRTFPNEAAVRSWSCRLELFTVDVETLGGWAGVFFNFEGKPAQGWLTKLRLVDRRYISLIVAMCEEFDLVTFFGERGKSADSLLRFSIRSSAEERREFDGFLMPIVSTRAKSDAKEPLYVPPSVLEGLNS